MAMAPTSTVAAQLKEQGNDEFRQGNYLKAAALYTKAIKEEPQSAVLYSNRAAALFKLNKLPKAWADATQAIDLDPDWQKGYVRAAAIAEAQLRTEQALELYKSAQRFKPSCRELSGKVKQLSRSLAQSGLNSSKASSLASNDKQSAPDTIKAAANGSSKKAGKDAGVVGVSADSSAAADQQAAAGHTSSKQAGSEAPWSGGALAPEVETFQQQMLEYATTKVMRDGTDFAPELHILDGEGNETAVRAPAAFKNPSTYTEFVVTAREQTEQHKAQAAVLLVPQAAVAFPRVWEKAGWPFGEEGGVLVQLQAPSQQQQLQQQNQQQQHPQAAADADQDTGKYVKLPSDSAGSSSALSGQEQDQHVPSNGHSSKQKAGGANGSSSSLCDRLWYLTDKGRDAWCLKEVSCHFGMLPQIIRT